MNARPNNPKKQVPNHSRPATLGRSPNVRLFGVCSHATNLLPRPSPPPAARAPGVRGDDDAQRHRRCGQVRPIRDAGAPIPDAAVRLRRSQGGHAQGRERQTVRRRAADRTRPARRRAGAGQGRGAPRAALHPAEPQGRRLCQAQGRSRFRKAGNAGRRGLPLEGPPRRIQRPVFQRTAGAALRLQAVRRLDEGEAVRDLQGLSSAMVPGRQGAGDQRRGRPQGALPAPPRDFLRLPRGHLRRRQEDRHLALPQGLSGEREVPGDGGRAGAGAAARPHRLARRGEGDFRP